MTNYAAFKYECDHCGDKLGDIGVFLYAHPRKYKGEEKEDCWCFCLGHKELKEDFGK